MLPARLIRALGEWGGESMDVIIAGAFGILGALLGGLVGGWFTRRSAQQQVEAVAAQTQGSVHERLYNQNSALHTIFAEYPDIRPYFYDRQRIDPSADAVHNNRVRVVAEMYAGFLELIAVHLPQLPNEVRTEWRAFIWDAYRLSPALRHCLKEHHSWYSSVLYNLLPTLRPMTTDDLDAVMDIMRDAYAPQFFEEREVLANKLTLFPPGCWVCMVGTDVIAYLFSHPSMFNDPPALNSKMNRFPDSANCYYIHDLAIRRKYQGQVIGHLLAEKASEIAGSQNVSLMALVSVQQSQSFWAKQGFVTTSVSREVRDKLRAYSEDANYMSRNI
jgi:GNAT superfamily N-acetyltransferase